MIIGKRGSFAHETNMEYVSEIIFINSFFCMIIKEGISITFNDFINIISPIYFPYLFSCIGLAGARSLAVLIIILLKKNPRLTLLRNIRALL